MKDILLINPPQTRGNSITANLPSYVDDNRGNIPPYGLLCIASAIEHYAYNNWMPRICDMSAGQELNGDKPDLVGITMTTFTLLDALKVAHDVKQRWGNVPVVAGGVHPSIYPMETLNLPGIDCVFVGEADDLFPKALDDICSGHIEMMVGELVDVHKLHVPAYKLLDKKRYYSLIGKHRHSTAMMTSRGCPYGCIYCNRKTMGKTFRARGAGQVIYEMRHLHNLGYREVLIYDDTFTVNRNRVMEICNRMRAEKLYMSFDIRTRVDHVDYGLLSNLKEAGCHRIHYGVEASSDRILNNLNKGISIDQVRAAFKATRYFGIEILAYFILGSPGETLDDIERTIELSKELEPDYCHYAIMTPYPATPLYDDSIKAGDHDDYWQKFAVKPLVSFQVPYWHEIDRETLERMLARAYKDFYIRPSMMARQLIKTRSVRQLLNKINGGLRIIGGCNV